MHLTSAVSRKYREETESPQCVSLTLSSGRREERIIELCEGMMDITAALFNVSSKELRSPGRGGLGVSRVRHIAMYVTHVALSVTMRDVGAGFGRDRTTVMYACHLVEDLRDDADFDRMVALTERVALAAFGNKASF